MHFFSLIENVELFFNPYDTRNNVSVRFFWHRLYKILLIASWCAGYSLSSFVEHSFTHQIETTYPFLKGGLADFIHGLLLLSAFMLLTFMIALVDYATAAPVMRLMKVKHKLSFYRMVLGISILFMITYAFLSLIIFLGGLNDSFKLMYTEIGIAAFTAAVIYSIVFGYVLTKRVKYVCDLVGGSLNMFLFTILQLGLLTCFLLVIKNM